ncbi:MAG: T9SS type A sorting domain-containing protein, partial [Bacteroidota bacterium]
AQAVFSNLGVEGGVDPDGLPVPWRSAQVGPGHGGEEAIFNGSAFSITGAGDVWGDADDFHWAYQAIEGNVSIRARLTRIAAPYDWSKAGLMVRESLARGSAHAFLVATPTRGTHLQTRDSTQAMMASHALTDDDPAVWLRLDRIGHVFTAFVSDDGQTWTPHGSFPVSMGPGVLVGLASTATDLDGAGVVSIGTFADVTVEPITGGRQPPPIAAFDTPAPFQLRGVYPNPFNPTTTVAFQVDESGFYAVEVFNLLGQRVYSDRFREESSTTREVRVDLSGHASGTYIVRVLHEATGYSVREKVVLLK